MGDGYQGYEALCSDNNLARLGCWAHARRKFIGAQRQQPKGKTGKADIALGFVQKLYRIEKRHKDNSADERFDVRQAEAKPIIDKLKKWLGKSIASSPPKSILGKALQYLNNRLVSRLHL